MGKFGQISRVYLPRSRLGRPLGYAFVDFVNDEDAQKAISTLHGQDGWKNFKLIVSSANAPQQRRQKQEQQEQSQQQEQPPTNQ